MRDEKGQFAGTGGGLTSSSDSNIIDGQKETTKATAIPTVPYRATPKPDDFIAARNLSTRPGFLSPLTEGDLTGHKLFLSEDGKVGGALSKDGDIGNVFNNGGPPGAARTIMLDMVKAGGKTLDAFDGYLPKLYANFGMEETGRMKFNPDYAPPGWDYDRHDNPDVVFMARTEQAAEKAGSFDDIRQRVNPSNDKTRAGWITHEKSTQYYDDYDRAKSDALSRAQSGRARSLSVAGAGVRQGVGGETGGAGAGRSPRVGRSLALLLDWDEAQHPRDERGRFGGGSGSGDLTPGEQALQTRLVDFKVDRNLTGPRSQAITESVPGSSFSQYVKVPGLDAMHAAMGVTPTLETNPLAYQASRDAMFAKQPEATIPFDKLTFTQPRINRDRVESLKTAEAQLNKPVQILKHGDNFYVMNGHHRAVAAYAAGRSGLKGHVFDTAQHLSAEVAVYEAARLLLLRDTSVTTTGSLRTPRARAKLTSSPPSSRKLRVSAKRALLATSSTHRRMRSIRCCCTRKASTSTGPMCGSFSKRRGSS